MNNLSKYSTKDIIIIISIIVVFILVFFIFYIEIIKNLKIENSNNNFNNVKQELIKEINKCKTKKEKWIFSISCEQELTTKVISDYFNNTKKIKNPYDGYDGVQGTFGSVQISIQNNLLVLSVDIDANGGIDIEHKILLINFFKNEFFFLFPLA